MRQARKIDQRGARGAFHRGLSASGAVPRTRCAWHDIDLYHTVATVRVPTAVSFGFGDARADIDFDPQLDHMNFRQLDPGTVFGRTQLELPIDVRDESGVT
jgi:hypothetical protein